MRGAARGRWAARWPSADVRSEGWSLTCGSACACPRWPAPRTASGWWAPARRPQPCAGCYSPWTGSRASSRSAATGAGCRCWSLQGKHEGSSDAGRRVKALLLLLHYSDFYQEQKRLDNVLNDIHGLYVLQLEYITVSNIDDSVVCIGM